MPSWKAILFTGALCLAAAASPVAAQSSDRGGTLSFGTSGGVSAVTIFGAAGGGLPGFLSELRNWLVEVVRGIGGGSATGPDRGRGGAVGGGSGNSGARAAPGPVAGLGLPFLVVAGAYILVRRRRTTARTPSTSEK